MDTVMVRLCVITTLTQRGLGTDFSPIRVITEVWDVETGQKIAENDPFEPVEPIPVEQGRANRAERT